MSTSKVLTKMWREMKENFQAILLKAKLEDKLPCRKDLVEHQESVQDLIDIFVAISNTGDVNTTKPSQSTTANTAQSSSEQNTDGASPMAKIEPTKSRQRRTLNDKHLDLIWSAYVQNHMQYLSREQIQVTAKEIDRSEDSVHYHLRKMIAAHRGISIENVLDDAFTKSEDDFIWENYARIVGGDRNASEGKIVTIVSHELHRNAEDVNNRLQWLKVHQNPPSYQVESDRSNDSTSAPEEPALPAHKEHQQKKQKHQQKHKKRRSHDESASETEEPHKHRRHKHYTSEENARIEKAYNYDNLSSSKIGQLVGRTTHAIEHRLRERGLRAADHIAPRAHAIKKQYPQHTDEVDISTDESTFETVERDTSVKHVSRGLNTTTTTGRVPATTATTNTASTIRVTASSSSQWFEDGRFSDAPRRRPSDDNDGAADAGDRKRRKRAADFMQDAFNCDTFDAGIDSYSDRDSN